MRSGRRSSRGCWRSSACIRRLGAAGSRGWRSRSMLLKPELDKSAKLAGKKVARSASRRVVSITITLLILGGLGYIGWTAMQQKQAGRGGARPDLPVPVVAAAPRIPEGPVYLEGMCTGL